MKKIRVGSRDSQLAIAQSKIIINEIQRHFPEAKLELVTMKTTGDLILDRRLDNEGGKGLFTRELDRALLDHRVDLAVHSLKDMPAQLDSSLAISAYCAEEDPRDALVLPAGAHNIQCEKPIGCAGRRRSAQLASIYPDWPCALIRGNVPTRLEKLDRREYGAVVLAAAGLKRLGLEHRIHRIFECEQMLPSAGQGILACVTRRELEPELAAIMQAIDKHSTRRRALCERAFVRSLGGGCGTPVAAFACEERGKLTLRGFYAPDGHALSVSGSIEGSAADGETLGAALAQQLLTAYRTKTQSAGKVSLVGAGPGDGGLLTLKGAAALAAADTVIFDKLAGSSVLAMIPARAEKIFAGKEAGNHAMSQDAINRLLVEKAAAGYKVVRLKGGDPCLFGRGGEEAQALAAAGIAFELVPGIPSALAVPACAGIPVTQRGVSASVHIIAARGMHEKKPAFDNLVKAGGTLVFLMGAAGLETLCQDLRSAGLDPGTPAAVIERGTTAAQKKLISTVGQLGSEAVRQGIKAPAIIIAGEVCRLSEQLSFFEKRKLAGVKIAVTSPRPSRLAALLAGEGAEVVELPVIAIEALESTPELEAALAGQFKNTWLVFTSAHAVELFFHKLKCSHIDVRALAGAQFAAVGTKTAAALEMRGIQVTLVAQGASGKSLGEELALCCRQNETVLLPRSVIASNEILVPLQKAGIMVRELPLYRTVAAAGFENDDYRALLVEGLHWAAFTSASTVENFIKLFGKEYPRTLKALCIGNASAAAAEKYGLPTVTANQATLEGMVEALLYSQYREHTI